MTINNTSERRLSMLQFAGLFAGALILSCFAFTKSFSLQQEIPAEELSLLREKQKIVQSISDLGGTLREYETEQLTGSLNIETKEAEVSEKMVGIRRQLLHKDTLTTYRDVQKLLDMASAYRLFIKRSSADADKKMNELKAQLAQLQQEKQAMTLEKANAQLDTKTAALASKAAEIETKTAGLKSAQAASKNVVAPVERVQPTAPNQPVVIAPTNTGNANCDAQVNQVKLQYQKACGAMKVSVVQIRADVGNISTGLLGGKSKKEKQSIETNLQLIERQIDALNN